MVDRDEDEALSFETSKEVGVVGSFDAMGLREDLLRGLYSYGLEKPSAIQQRAIVPMIKGMQHDALLAPARRVDPGMRTPYCDASPRPLPGHWTCAPCPIAMSFLATSLLPALPPTSLLPPISAAPLYRRHLNSSGSEASHRTFSPPPNHLLMRLRCCFWSRARRHRAGAVGDGEDDDALAVRTPDDRHQEPRGAGAGAQPHA
jgi:hypothetical protein